MASLLGFASAGYGYTVVVLLTFFVCVCVRFRDFSHELDKLTKIFFGKDFPGNIYNSCTRNTNTIQIRSG